jgi:hypothetical protein
VTKIPYRIPFAVKPGSEHTYDYAKQKAHLQDSASPAVPPVQTDASGNQHQSYVDEWDPSLPLAPKLYSMLPTYVDHERGKPAKQSQYENSIQ